MDAGNIATPLDRRFIGSTPTTGQYLRTSAFFVPAYLLTNLATSYYRFDGTAITLWSPDNGLSLLLLLDSSLFAPVVFVSAVLADFALLHSSESVRSIGASEALSTLSYLIAATLLRDAFGYDYRRATYSNAIRLIAAIPVTSVLAALLACAALFLGGNLRADQFARAVQTYWIGDSVGMIVLIPAATAFYDLTQNRDALRSLSPGSLFAAALIFVGLAGLVAASVGLPDSRYLFSLLFLPIIWVGVSYGFRAVALTLLATQGLLIVAMHYLNVGAFNFSIFQMQMFVLAATGQLLGTAISEREDAMRALRRQQNELVRVSAQATTGALAVAFAHEISQPLSALSGYVHSAKRLLAGRSDMQNVATVIDKAEDEVRRTREIVVRIREFVATGTLDLREADLAQVARDIVAVNSEDARTRNVRLLVAAPEQAIDAVVDRVAIEQALNNLVVNAIEAADPNAGESRHVWIVVSSIAGVAKIEVEDDGPGVPPEIAARLFQPFETTKPRGMGLGLALAAEVVSKHRGKLTWSAREPHGAKFVIELPVAARSEVRD